MPNPLIEKNPDANTETAIEPPYRVLIHNDDVTPIDFVIMILMKIFNITPIIAEHITMAAHMSGIAYVATYSQAEAERRVNKAHFAAQMDGYPLTFSIEPE